MLLEIGEPSRAESYIETRLGARAGLSKHERGNPKVRVPGFGHRVYRVDDARARVLRGMAKSMAEATGRQKLFEVAERVYDAMRARTTLPVNVDFFSAVVYDAPGIPPDFCTSIFAVGRRGGGGTPRAAPRPPPFTRRPSPASATFARTSQVRKGFASTHVSRPFGGMEPAIRIAE